MALLRALLRALNGLFKALLRAILRALNGPLLALVRPFNDH
jgi:hypothetical protein